MSIGKDMAAPCDPFRNVQSSDRLSTRAGAVSATRWAINPPMEWPKVGTDELYQRTR